MNNNSITVGIADDQRLFLKGLEALIGTFPSFKVIIDASNGEDLLQRLQVASEEPDILLIDVNMPLLDGPGVVAQIRERYPAIRMAALSIKDDDATIIRMIRSGCCAYLLKDIHPTELEKALHEIHSIGSYNADAYNINYRRLTEHERKAVLEALTNRELTFLKWACSDLTYKQIAAKMYLSERTIDGYRDSVFEKLCVQSRVGMVLEAIRRRLVEI